MSQTRRNFLRCLPFIPSALKAVAVDPQHVCQMKIPSSLAALIAELNMEQVSEYQRQMLRNRESSAKSERIWLHVPIDQIEALRSFGI